MFDLCLTNPPFGSMETDPEVLARFDLGQGVNSQDRVILAVERCLDLVKPGGWVGIVVIDGVLNTASRSYVRDLIKRRAWVRGVVSLNAATFEGYGARAKTSILFLERKAQPDDGAQEPVFMAIARNTGLAANGASIAGNELPDILMDYRAYRAGERRTWRHRESGVFTLKDRLDAEHYLRGRVARSDGVGTLQQQVREAMERGAELYGTLAAVEAHFAAMETRPAQIGELLEEIRCPETVRPDHTYRLLGVRWWGEGAFIREEKPGRELRSKKLFRVTAGDLIYNRLFAYRGSFAILPPEFDGCHVSGEFPTFRAKPTVPHGDLVCRFIVHVLNSEQSLAAIDAESTGSTKTSRNRFNQTQFVQMSVQLPTTADALKRSVELLDAASALRSEQTLALKLAKELRDAVHALLQPQQGRLTDKHH